jgi:FkbM family methyltransferase
MTFAADLLLKKVPVLYDLKTAVGHRLSGNDAPLHRLLDRYTRSKQAPVTFLQVGANDGLWNDPLRYFVVSSGWRGVLVEPLPEAFAALRKNYRRQRRRLHFLRSAVSPAGRSSIELYRVDPSFLRTHTGRRALSALRKTSFSREHLERFVPAQEHHQIVTERVPAEDLPGLWASGGMGPIPDVVAIDIEGYESEVLLNHDFAAWAPELLVFEAIHMAPAVRQAIFQRLADAGYTCRGAGIDVVAMKAPAAWAD